MNRYAHKPSHQQMAGLFILQYYILSVSHPVLCRCYAVFLFKHVTELVSVAVSVFCRHLCHRFIGLQQLLCCHIQFGVGNKLLCADAQHIAAAFIQITLGHIAQLA